jgi:hypothetical protein
MSLDRKILEELKRFNQINSYIIREQDVPPPPPDPAAADPTAVDPAAGGAPDPAAADPAAAGAADPAAAGATEVPEPVDVENDPDVEELTPEDEGEEETEEIDITDLVTTQQEIQAKQDEFMDGIFTKLDDLESKLSNMDEIMRIVKKHNLLFIEDCAQSHGSKYNDKRTGTFGDIACFSFYPGKNLGCYGDGGAICTNNTVYYDKLRLS